MNFKQNKKFIMLLIASIFFIFAIIAAILGGQIYRRFQNERLAPAPTPYLTPSPDDVLVVKSAPQDESVDVSRTQTLRIEFNREPREDEFIFLISPDTPHILEISGTTLSISPEEMWAEGMPYRYVIRYTEPGRSSQGFDFVTAGIPAETLPDTQPEPTYIIGQSQYELEHFPDTYVANRTPFENEYFFVESDFKRGNPQGHSYFLVAPKTGISEEDVRIAFNEWLLSIGLRQDQINALDIEYLF